MTGGEEPVPRAEVAQHPILFFDGVCGMCNRFVDVILKADRRGVLHFAPLQGETARRMLPPLQGDPAEWSLLYLDERGLHDHWDASIGAYRRLGGLWLLLTLPGLIPRRIRNPLYRIIARNRYRWFGRRAACRLPTPEEASRFLP